MPLRATQRGNEMEKEIYIDQANNAWRVWLCDGNDDIFVGRYRNQSEAQSASNAALAGRKAPQSTAPPRNKSYSHTCPTRVADGHWDDPITRAERAFGC